MDIKSECCQANINFEPSPESWKGDTCSNCGEEMSYALLIPHWAKRESCKVYEDFHGKYWFFWHRLCRWQDVIEFTKKGQQYLGQIKRFVASLSSQLQKDGDCIEMDRHIQFMLDHKDLVQNPELADLLINKS